MSKLFIPSAGNASESKQAGSGGIVLGRGSRIHGMSYDLSSGHQIAGVQGTEANAGAVALLTFPSSNHLYQTNNDGSQSSAWSPKLVGANGLIILANNDVELAPLYKNATSASALQKGCTHFVVGEQAFYMKATLQSDDVTDLTRVFVGFKKVEAHQADVDDADEAYGVSLKTDDSAAKKINEFKILNAAATSETDTSLTLADATDISIEIRVSSAGVCTAIVDGTTLDSDTHSILGMTFDTGEEVYPAIHSTTGGAGTLEISVLEFGYLAEK